MPDLALAADGEPHELTLVESSFPSPQQMRAGMGTIRLRPAAGASEGTTGRHSLSYRNDHEPVDSRCPVNAFRVAGGVEISAQDRDRSQNSIRVDYSVASEDSAASGADERTSDSVSGGNSGRPHTRAGAWGRRGCSQWAQACRGCW